MKRIKVSLHNHLGRRGRNPGFDKTIDLVYDALGEKSVFGIGNCDDNRYENFVGQRGEYERVFIGCAKSPIAVYVPEKQIMIVRGQEVFSDKGHFLVFGYERNIERRNLDDGLKEAVDNEAILGIDHRYYLKGLGKFLEKNSYYEGYFDFDEVYNGTSEIGKWFIGPRNANEMAIDNYKKYLLGKKFRNPRKRIEHYIGAVAFSDTHQLKRFGRNIIKGSYTSLELSFMQDKEKASKIGVREFIDELRCKLQHSTLDNCFMQPNKLDALVHAFNMVVINKLERLFRIK